MDREVIEQKLESLRACLQRIAVKCPPEAETLAADADLQDIVVLNLTRAIQLCVDIGAHLIAGMDVPPPETMGQTFDVLGRAGVIDPNLALLDLPATLSLSDCLRTLKSNSSKWIHGKGPERSKFAWQQGYAAFSVSKSGVDGVVRYIEQQHEHHRRVTYQEEVRRFLAEHGMACDERYMWE